MKHKERLKEICKGIDAIAHERHAHPAHAAYVICLVCAISP